MTWNFRVRPGVGPLHANISKRGLRSISFTLWRYTKNLRTGRSSFDTPGPGSIQWGGKPRERQTGSGIRFVLGFLFCTGMLALIAGIVLYAMFLRH
jgi:hypothetical protein